SQSAALTLGSRRTRQNPVLLPLTRGNHDRGFRQQVLLDRVDAVAARLAKAAADALVGEDDGRDEAGSFDGIAVRIGLGVHLYKLDRVIPGRGAVVHA